MTSQLRKISAAPESWSEQPAGKPTDNDPFLTVVTRIFSRFVHLAPEQVPAEIDAALQQVLDYFGADRCDLFEVDSSLRQVQSVARAQHADLPVLPETIDAGLMFPWLYQEIVCAQRNVCVLASDQWPPDAETDAGNMLAFEIRSALLIPITDGAAVTHVIGIGARNTMHISAQQQQLRLKLLGEILVTALHRHALQQAQLEASRFERLISEIAARFSGAWSDQIDQEIRQALIAVLQFTEVDQAGFIEVYPETGQAFLTYLAHAEGVVPSSMTIEYASLFPWSNEILVKQGNPMVLDSLDRLPPEAAKDLEAWRASGIHAVLNIPFNVGGAVRYVFAMTTNGRNFAWPRHYVDRLRALGDVFVSALGRKAVMGALRKAQSFTHAALEALHRHFCVVDHEARVISHSAGWTELYPPQAGMLGQDFFQRFMRLQGQSETDAAQFNAALVEVIRGERQPFVMESSCGLDDDIRWVRSRITAFELDRKTYAVISHEDITARKQAEIELEALRSQHWHADRVTRTAVLISSLSHELSQPMTAILSNAQAGLRFLSREDADQQKIVDILKDIVADNKRAAEVIESLRVIIRRQKTERRRVDVSQLLNDVLGLLHGELVAQQVDVEVEADEGCEVNADPAQLQQVFLNLMINGLDAMRESPLRRFQLRVWKPRQQEVRISIRDSGIGIDGEAQEKPFEAFWTTKAQGTGMGLPICRAIIESHDGRIWLEPGSERGATFSILLPEAGPSGMGQG